MVHLYVRNAQEKSCCGISSMQMFSFTHPACPFLQKIQSSLALMYLEPHKGHVITPCCQNTLLSSVNTASGCAGWTASSSAGLWQLASLSTRFSYLPSAPPHFLCLSGMNPSGCRACLQDPCTGPHSGLSLHSQQSNIHPPTSQNHLKMDPEHPKADTWSSDGLGGSQGRHLMFYSHSLSCCSTGKADSTTNNQHRSLNLATLKQNFDPQLHPG